MNKLQNIQNEINKIKNLLDDHRSGNPETELDTDKIIELKDELEYAEYSYDRAVDDGIKERKEEHLWGDE